MMSNREIATECILGEHREDAPESDLPQARRQPPAARSNTPAPAHCSELTRAGDSSQLHEFQAEILDALEHL
jgi:hypothetical protein